MEREAVEAVLARVWEATNVGDEPGAWGGEHPTTAVNIRNGMAIAARR